MGTAAVTPQHLHALNRANEVRLARAELRRRVKSGEQTAGEVILEAPWEASSMSVGELLMCQTRWGRQRTLKLLGQIPVSETKTVGKLTERQRHALADLLGA